MLWGEEIKTLGATLYPTPALIMLIDVIVPAELTTATAEAEEVVTPVVKISFVKDTDGGVE